jgi:hypothetical protein
MNRIVIGLLFTAVAAAPGGVATAQAAGCTYDACALRLQHRFWSGITLVQGHEARRVARVGGLFAPHVDLLASAPDSAKAHYLAFRTNQNRGGAFMLLGAVFAAAAGALAYDQYEGHEGVFWGLLGAGLTFSIIGGGNVRKANDHLEQSIWFYNRELPRGPQ